MSEIVLHRSSQNRTWHRPAACIRPRFGFCKAVAGVEIHILRAVGFLLLSTACSVLLADGGDAISFNRDVRPILSDRCYACHGPESRSRQAGLRLDSEESAKSPLKSGHVAVMPGDLSKSALFGRVTSSDKSVRMPPASAGRDALTPAETEILKRWIEQGAVWQQHWSFIPPARATAPPGRNPIDFFVTSQLNKEGLRASRPADPATLLRRVTLDLTGLPPTMEEVQAFLKDPSSATYERAVDRLLATPAYGERMAYRWMEAARYADTNGYQTDGNREMWRWRDWVIDAFNKNMPFDRFTIEQIAGDLLPNPTLDQRIATGFQRNHRTNAEGGIVPEEYRVEYVADRVETTSTVFLGLTLGCARCHDHKYDPLKQTDFYRMFAFYNQVPEKGLVYNWGNDDPLMKAPTPDQQQKLAALDTAADTAGRRYSALEPKIVQAQQKWVRQVAKRGAPSDNWTVTAGLLYRQQDALRLDGKQFHSEKAENIKLDFLDPFTLSARIKPDCETCAIVSKTEDYTEGSGHGLYLMDGRLRLHVIFRWTDIGMRVETEDRLRLHEWQTVTVTYDGKRYASGVRMYVDGKPQRLKILFDELNWPMDVKEPLRIGAGGGLRYKGEIADARVYSRALKAEEASALSVTDPVSAIARRTPAQRPPAEENVLRLCFLDTAASPPIRRARLAAETARSERDRFYASLPSVMVMKDEPGLRKSYVLKRGAYDAHGQEVTPGVPAVLPQLRPEWPANRLGLARWLVSRDNPLTARVTVNRLWQAFFGVGLVKTVEDFGSQGEWPAYQDVLDWLAVEFMDSGWDLKHVVKTIVMTDTYRQSSRVTPELLQRDPDNRLLARGPRVRLPAEMIRDQALAVSGLLVNKVGGPSVKPYQPPGLWQELANAGDGYVPDKGEGLYRRTLYTFWKRTVAPPALINFDSPTRETCTVRESRTNTPLQALTLMNDVTYVEAARKLAEAVLRQGGSSSEARIDYAYQRVLGRPARDKERSALLAMLERFEQRYRSDPKAALQLIAEGASARDEKLDPSELAAYTAVASLMLNLDETVSKE